VAELRLLPHHSPGLRKTMKNLRIAGHLARILGRHFPNISLQCREPGSSAGIVTDYGLDGPGLNPRRDEIFRPSRPALGPTQPSVQWVPGLSQG
jgi:hypothetical protein